ncbi:hypothetical protein [Ligilactobacillus salivarius]|nr:hypothetical protein [Ligilactobacillus salivarius]WHS14851.1 hypothetical protein O2U03_04175 [Ligilactobacillus salivarius]
MDKDKRIEELEKENQQLHKKIEELSETIKLSMPVFLEKKRKN